MTMRMALVLFMLCSGLVHSRVAGNRLRWIDRNDKDVQFQPSLKLCMDKGGSAMTLYDENDATFIHNFPKEEYKSYWLGLQKKQDNTITWSNGSTCAYGVSNLGSETEGGQTCAAVVNNTWTGFDCSKQEAFMCYRGDKLHLIENVKKNWCQAQQHCRRHFTDLVSICDHEQNLRVLEKGNNKTFWIGLMRDKWEWADKSCSTYRNWETKLVDRNCTAKVRGTPNMRRRRCSSPAPSLCSYGNRRIITVNQSLSWDEALTYCENKHTDLLQIYDERDQKAVAQWLNYTQSTNDPFWIGVRQSRIFGFWILRNSGVTYSNWAQEPQPAFYENCAVVNGQDYKWRDVECSAKHHFLCEEDISYH